jgi:hypothetical protein
MAHFAQVQDGIVTQVIVADASFIASGAVGNPTDWVQTSYNTRGGVHYAPNSDTPDGGEQIGYNYAGIGYSWDGTGFAAPQPFPSWTLDKSTYLWAAPVPYPTTGGPYVWDEATQSWITLG